jgi:thiamine pyrophosphokinase
VNALILCHGEPPSADLLQRYLPQASLVICTDGAVHWALEAGVHPHVIVGDMDSCAELPDCEIVDCGPHGEQQNSDSEKALLQALMRGAGRIVLLGATGRRLDHTLANVWLLYRYHDCAEIIMVDDWTELRVASSRQVVATTPGQRVSLLALTPDVVLDTEGLRWPLHGPFEMGTRGLSNEADGETVVLDVHSGMVAVIVPV